MEPTSRNKKLAKLAKLAFLGVLIMAIVGFVVIAMLLLAGLRVLTKGLGWWT